MEGTESPKEREEFLSRLRNEWDAQRPAERRRQRETKARGVFAEAEVHPVLDLLELLDRAWHDCYGDTVPPDDIIDDVLLLSEGRLDYLIYAARLAVTDWRDVKANASRLRGSTP